MNTDQAFRNAVPFGDLAGQLFFTNVFAVNILIGAVCCTGNINGMLLGILRWFLNKFAKIFEQDATLLGWKSAGVP